MALCEVSLCSSESAGAGAGAGPNRDHVTHLHMGSVGACSLSITPRLYSEASLLFPGE